MPLSRVWEIRGEAKSSSTQKTFNLKENYTDQPNRTKTCKPPSKAWNVTRKSNYDGLWFVGTPEPDSDKSRER